MYHYIVTENFMIDGRPYLKGSTFSTDDKFEGNAILSTGLTRVLPKSELTINAPDETEQIGRMSKAELLALAEREEIPIPQEAKTVVQIRRIISACRAEMKGRSNNLDR